MPDAVRGAFSYLLKAAFLLAAVSLAAFALVRLSPLDPVTAYVGADASVSLEQRARIAERWGLNEAAPVQFFKWFSALCRGDFGVSVIYRQPVLTVISQRAAASLALMGLSWALSGVLGFVLGVIAGACRGRWPDRLIKAWCLALSSSPAFWLALILMVIFAVTFKLFPLGLAAPAGKLASEVTLLERLRHLVLPCLALSLTGVSNIALQTRQKLAEVMESDYFVYAVARGESKWTAVRRHGLRNIALPALTLQFLSFSELFGGSVLAEQVFAYPGLGRAIVQAGMQSDVPLLLGITLFSALFVFTGNCVADALYRRVHPEIRGRHD